MLCSTSNGGGSCLRVEGRQILEAYMRTSCMEKGFALAPPEGFLCAERDPPRERSINIEHAHEGDRIREDSAVALCLAASPLVIFCYRPYFVLLLPTGSDCSPLA